MKMSLDSGNRASFGFRISNPLASSSLIANPCSGVLDGGFQQLGQRASAESLGYLLPRLRLARNGGCQRAFEGHETVTALHEEVPTGGQGRFSTAVQTVHQAGLRIVHNDERLAAETTGRGNGHRFDGGHRHGGTSKALPPAASSRTPAETASGEIDTTTPPLLYTVLRPVSIRGVVTMVKVVPDPMRMKFEPIVTAMSTDARPSRPTLGRRYHSCSDPRACGSGV